MNYSGEVVQAGAGLIRFLADGVTFLSIDINDAAQVRIYGMTVTIDPSVNLALNTPYEVHVDAGTLLDESGNSFTGLNGYEFTTVAGSNTLAGSVTFWKNGSAMSAVWGLLKEEGILERVSGSGEDGAYAYQGLAGGDYTLGAVKDTCESDTDAVTTDDAVAALDLLFGGESASAYQYLAADVNRDGSVGFRDVIGILKMALHREASPAEWTFVPSSTGSEHMDNDNVNWSAMDIPVTLDQDKVIDLVGVLLGDVDGSWGAFVA